MIDVTALNIRYITDKEGNKKEVILSINEFENLLEDLDDLAIAAERRNEELISHEDVIKKLRDDGIIQN